MTTQFNSSSAPYFDDFDPSKGFAKILFKPGNSVQTRELNQIQSIIQNQLGSFGKNIFKQGSVVVPGNAFTNLSVPYVTFSSFSGSTDLYLNTVLVSTSGVTARVNYIVPATSSDPVTMYLTYLSGGSNGATTFVASESLSVQGAASIPNITVSALSPTGFGSFAHINEGVYFVNNTFANVNKQSIVISKYTSTPSVQILLRIDESIATSYTDSSLFDNAQGSDNYAAPGADRLVITLTLTSLPYGTALNDNYVLLMSYDSGVLQEQVLTSSYNEIEKELASRTYDESGDFVQTGYDLSIIESLNTGTNGGYSTTGSASSMVYQVTPGNAYLKGFQKKTLANTYLTVDKARTADHIFEKDNVIVSTDYGQSILVTGINGSPNFAQFQAVQLWTTDNTGTSGTLQIGTAKVFGVQYYAGVPTSNTSINQFFLTDLKINSGYTIENVGGLVYTGGTAIVVQQAIVNQTSGTFVAGELVNYNAGVRVATVRYVSGNNVFFSRNSATALVPRTGDTITGATSSAVATITSKNFILSNTNSNALLPLPYYATNSLTNGNSQYVNSFTVWASFTITTNSSGNGSASATGTDYINQPSPGQMIAFYSAGMVPLSNISVTGGNTITITGGPASTSVTVFVTVAKTNATPKTKTLVTQTITAAAGSTISLGYSDVQSLTSVTLSGSDITSNFTLDGGQRDYYYGLGSISTGQTYSGTLSITFTYFQHSTSGSYFCVDSYSSLGTDYISKIPSYVSSTNGAVYSLQNVIDFRQTVGSDGSFSSGTANLVSVPTPESRFSLSCLHYVPRIDVVGIAQNGGVIYLRGTPADAPSLPSIGSNFMPLFYVSVPPYTANISLISPSDVRIKGYTMEQIGSIDTRVKNLEVYAAITSAEKSLLSTSITDPVTGLTRPNTGYISETFSDLSTTSVSFTDPESRATMTAGAMTPGVSFATHSMYLMAASNNFVDTGGLLTLPYTHVPLAKQSNSTQVENVNPFSATTWAGVLTISPAVYTWTSTTQLPDVSVTNYVTTYSWTNVGSSAPVAFYEVATVLPSGPNIPIGGVGVNGGYSYATYTNSSNLSAADAQYYINLAVSNGATFDSSADNGNGAYIFPSSQSASYSANSPLLLV
jgi:hypothetical protein